MILSLQDGMAVVEGVAFSASTPRVRLAHAGLKLLNTIPRTSVPEDRYLDWREQGWLVKKPKVCPVLAACLAEAIGMADLEGALLWDTMRKGSDYWRPGNLLLQTADLVRNLDPGRLVEYARIDEICPPPEMLQEFMSTAMPFGDYATRYAAYLRQDDRITGAAGQAILSLARGMLPVYYCTDPYVPGLADPAQQISAIPYSERTWNPPRAEACHRVILVEEIAREFLRIGIDVEILELDQSRGRVHKRSFRGDEKPVVGAGSHTGDFGITAEVLSMGLRSAPKTEPGVEGVVTTLRDALLDEVLDVLRDELKASGAPASNTDQPPSAPSGQCPETMAGNEAMAPESATQEG